MKKNSWTGKTWYCPNCGSELIEEEVPEELYSEDFSNDIEYQRYLKSRSHAFTYHCSNEQCYYHLESFYTLFHPLRGYDSAPGESWAIGFVK